MQSRLIHSLKSRDKDGSYLDSLEVLELKGEEVEGGTEYDGILGNQSDEPSHVLLSNMESSIQELQEVLKYTPFKGTPDKNPKFGFEPLVESEVRMQKSSIMNVEWRPYYMSVVDSVLYLKHDAHDEKNSFAERICYACIDSLSLENMHDKKVGELYFGYLEKQNARFCFKIYTPRKMMLFLVDSVEKRDHIVEVICEHLKSVFGDALWNAKVKAAESLEPLMREQFVADLEKQELVLQALAQSGIVSDISILSSPDKDKSGVLKMYQHNEFFDKDDERHGTSDQWVDYYFVLFSDVLYYFKNSKATIPTGFVSLRYATVDIDRGCLMRGEYVFTITTPMRTMTLMTKHAVSLSTWISALERSILKIATKRNGGIRTLHRRDSETILKEIERLQSPVASLTVLLRNHKGLEAFRKYLRGLNMDNELECLKEIKGLSAIDSDQKEQRSRKAKEIFERFVTNESKEYVSHVDKQIVEKLQSVDLNSPSLDVFKDLWQHIVIGLKDHFEKFKETEYCQQFLSEMKGKLHPDERVVEPFDVEEKVLGFTVDLKAKGKVKVIRFDMSKNVLTIGRDISNDIVIEDERISRAHARIDFSRQHCKYMDLGSAHGSKLNGEKFTTAFLQLGDVVKIGSTTLRLELMEPPLMKKVLKEFSTIFAKNRAVV